MSEKDSKTENGDDNPKNIKTIYKAIETLLDGIKCDKWCLECPFWNTQFKTCKVNLFLHPEKYFILGRLNLKSQIEHNDELKELMRLIGEKQKQ